MTYCNVVFGFLQVLRPAYMMATMSLELGGAGALEAGKDPTISSRTSRPFLLKRWRPREVETAMQSGTATNGESRNSAAEDH